MVSPCRNALCRHHAFRHLITYIDERKRGGAKLVRLLTNDLETEYGEIVAIYKARWAIDSLFYVKHIVMRSNWKIISDYQCDTKTLLRSTSHNISYFFVSIR